MQQMLRPILVLLLIACLVACPFKCLGGEPSERASAEQSRSYSCCASHFDTPSQGPSESGPEHGKQTPPTPEGGCHCNGCVCEGAVRMDEDHDPSHDVFVTVVWLADFLPPSPVCGGLAVRPSDGPPAVPSAAGRSLRLVIESLQI
jgi:hypothetical protein